MNKTKAELLAEIDYLQEELRLAMKAGEVVSQQYLDAKHEVNTAKAWMKSSLEANEVLLADLAKIPRWVQWLFGVRQGD
jgi:hypothetical protein